MADMEIVLVSFCSCLLSLCMLDFVAKKYKLAVITFNYCAAGEKKPWTDSNGLGQISDICSSWFGWSPWQILFFSFCCCSSCFICPSWLSYDFIDRLL